MNGEQSEARAASILHWLSVLSRITARTPVDLDDPAFGLQSGFEGEGAPAMPPSARSPAAMSPPDVSPAGPSPADTLLANMSRPGPSLSDTSPSGTSPPDTSPPGTSPPGTSPPGTSPPGTSPPGTSPPDLLPQARGRPVPAAPSGRLWDTLPPDVSVIGIRLDAPLADADRLALPLASAAVERGVIPVILCRSAASGLERFGFRTERVTGATPAARAACEAELVRFWGIAIVIDAADVIASGRATDPGQADRIV